MKSIIRKNRGALALSVLCTLFSSLFAVALQFVKGMMLDDALAGLPQGAASKGGLLALLIAAEIGMYHLGNRARGRFATRCTLDMRLQFARALFRLSPRAFAQGKQGDYVAKYTNQIDLIARDFIANIPLMAEILIKIALASAALFWLDYRIALITLVLLTTPLYVPKLAEKRLARAQKKNVEALERHLGKVVEWLGAFELIRNYSIEGAILRKFEASAEEAREANWAMRKMSYLYRSITTCLSYGAHFAVLAAAACLVALGEFSAGDFFVAVSMIDQLSYPILSLSAYLQEIVAARPIAAEMEKEWEEQEKTGGTELFAPAEICFSDVTFGYDEDRNILDGFSLRIPPGGKVLLQGPSGIGKSTCIDLLLGYWEPGAGSVTLNGIPAREAANLMELLTVMRQDAVLFDDTLYDNVAMYHPADDEAVCRALRLAGLGAYANPEGLRMQIAEGGSNLSGGEKRRVALARALLRPSAALILDEPLAGLDGETAALVEETILSIQGRTVLVISHRFSGEKLCRFDNVVTLGG